MYRIWSQVANLKIRLKFFVPLLVGDTGSDDRVASMPTRQQICSCVAGVAASIPAISDDLEKKFPQRFCTQFFLLFSGHDHGAYRSKIWWDLCRLHGKNQNCGPKGHQELPAG